MGADGGAITQEKLNSQWSTGDAWYEVETGTNGTIQQLQRTVGEGDDNYSNGKEFTCVVPDNGFKITPIYQGGNINYDVEFHMVVADEYGSQDYLIWSKSEHLEKRCHKCEGKGTVVTGYINKREVTCDLCNGSGWIPAKINYQSGYDEGYNGTTYGGGKAYEKIRARTLSINKGDLPVGASIIFYTKDRAKSDSDKWSDLEGGTTVYWWSKVPDSPRAGIDRLGVLALKEDKISIPNNIKDHETNGVKHKVLFISCEAGTDKDLNDVVFLFEGEPYIPETIETKDESEPVVETVSKRYMVEDLGASDKSDIDFNDIVVDLIQTTSSVKKTTTTIVDGKVVSSVEVVGTPTISQTAQIYALGGTKDIEVYIGQTMIFKKSTATNINTGYPGNLVKLNPEKMYNTGTGLLDKTENSDTNYETSTAITTVQTLSDNPWVPNGNNIWVKVYADSENSSSVDKNQAPTKDSWKIAWPETGTVPQIIAVDTDKTWNQERVSVFTKEGEPGYNLNILKLVEDSKK